MARLRVVLLVVVILGVASRLLALTCSGPSPDVVGAKAAWKLGAIIKVTASNFPPNLQPCVQKAFDGWNAANPSTNANGNASDVQYSTVVFGSPDTSGQTNTYQITWSATKPDNSPMTTAGVTGGTTNGTNRTTANSTINTNQTDCTQLTHTVAHEIGHTEGLGDCTACSSGNQSIMFGGIPPYILAPTGCDNTTVKTIYHPPPPPPIPGCEPDCPAGSRTCIPCGGSPIILDLTGEGFHLTGAENGVLFDISGTGDPVQIAWTASGSANAFLVLPASDGLVHGGKQLFGNFTPQPPSNQPNGFIALSVYDDPINGDGNGDGIIDARDAVFALLRLWVDTNHDGISQAGELYTLPALGVNSISLRYKWDKQTDQYGNVFRFRAKLNSDKETDVGKIAYDVFFVTANPIAANPCNPAPVSVKTGGR